MPAARFMPIGEACGFILSHNSRERTPVRRLNGHSGVPKSPTPAPRVDATLPKGLRVLEVPVKSPNGGTKAASKTPAQM